MSIRLRRSAALLLGCCALAHHLGAVPAPYTDDFNSYGAGQTPSGFIESNDAAWGTSVGAYVSTTGPEGTSSVFSSISLENVAGQSFIFSSTLTFTIFGTAPLTIHNGGMTFLGTSPGSGLYISYSFRGPDAGRLVVTGGRSAVSLTPTQGVPYVMTLRGDYIGSSLALTGSLSNGLETISVSTLVAAPPAGTYFGYFNSTAVQAMRLGQQTIAFDDFAVTFAPPIPEPSLYLLLVAGALACVGLCRRSISRFRRRGPVCRVEE